MPPKLTESQKNELKKFLKQRFFDLREEVRQELLNSDDENYLQLAGQVHDMEEASVADLLVDLNLATIDQHIDQIREVDAALLRISKGQYGTCIDCGAEIDYQRLQAQPTAKRCVECQNRYEKMFAHKNRPTL